MKHTPRRILRYFYYTQFMRKINNFTQVLFRHFGHNLKNPKSHRGKSTIGCMRFNDCANDMESDSESWQKHWAYLPRQ